MATLLLLMLACVRHVQELLPRHNHWDIYTHPRLWPIVREFYGSLQPH